MHSGADAAKKPALSKKKLSIKVGESKKLTVKNYKKKVTWKTSKASVAKLSAKKKTSVKVTGKKERFSSCNSIIQAGRKN